MTAYNHTKVTHIVTAGEKYDTPDEIQKIIVHSVRKIPLKIKIVHRRWVEDCRRAGKIVEPRMVHYVHYYRLKEDWKKAGGIDTPAATKALIQIDARKPRPKEPTDSEEDEEMQWVTILFTLYDKLKWCTLSGSESGIKQIWTTRSQA